MAYKEALEAGRAGVDCLAHFVACPKGESLLDAYSVDVEY